IVQLIMPVVLAIMFGCGPSRTRQEVKLEMLPKEQLDKEVATQKHINTYFHDKVTPKLTSCWGALKGSGMVRIDIHFVLRDKAFAPEKATLSHSTIPDDQNDAALKCMGEAVKDTSFMLDSTIKTDNRFLVSWNWPVPFPSNYEEQYQAMQRSPG